MPKDLIKFGNITKRSASKNAKSIMGVNECNCIEKNYRVIASKIGSSNDSIGIINTIKHSANKILESLTDSNTANKYKFYPISIVEKIQNLDQGYATSIIERYCNTVIPYITDLTSIEESIDEYQINDQYKNRILKEISIYNACDRIMNNHDVIKKRFNIEDVILKNKYNLKPAIESVCTMIDTYNRDTYQKVNICIEESYYILEKNGIKYDKANLVNSILEYFFLDSDHLSSKSYNSCKKCITESCILGEDEISKIKYLFKDTENSTINAFITSFIIAEEKTPEYLISTINNCLYSDIIDLNYNFKSIVQFIAAIYKSVNLISDTDLELAMEKIQTSISARLVSLIVDAEISRDILDTIIASILDTIEETNSYITVYPRLYNFIQHFKAILTTISEYYNYLYDKNNIEIIKVSENCTTEIPIQEAQLLKAHNLFVAIRNLDKYLGDKCKDLLKKVTGTDKNNPTVRDKISKFLYGDEKTAFDKALATGISNEKKFLSGIAGATKALLAKKGLISENTLYGYISEESGIFDMTIASIKYDESEVPEIHKQLGDLCKEFNYILENNISTNNCKTYYMINPDSVSLHLIEAKKYKLDSEAINKIQEATNEDYIIAIEKISEATAIGECIDTLSSMDINDSVFNIVGSDKDMEFDTFKSIIEGLSILETDSSIISKLADMYNNKKYYSITEDVQLEAEYNKVDKLVKSYSPVKDSSIESKLEAYQLLDVLVEVYTDEDFEDDDDEEDDSNNKSKVNKEKDGSLKKDQDIEKNPYKGLNLKSIKLCLLGLKSKFSKMSQKEKEISRNVDASFKHLVESFKNAMISDSRESVIRGSVIPSFSKCLKIGLAAAVGIGSGIINPGVAAIAAIGSFAVSKKLTQRERILLLDEIESELDVVDKEIQMAERDEDMKKYRALLQYKKNLQRQYQRIRYNVKVGKNILPGSNAGISGDRQNGY